ncbi:MULTISPECIES: DNA-binding protein [Shewanella]|jgi:hypothetical protein|uniref:DNA-binding protein n=1 Tax=Shewanella TaxID=22 RepID=UPI00217D4E2C|nr:MULTISPECIES: DNA-binding protein [Shewanella]MCS6258834.1 DNA-binding protein [Shewanella baltica]MCU8032727.1 DNA-binding protein [Shewanella sp. SM71]MCU8094613.1 DNA-binding protein [Shewanella sp. SM102]
MSLITISVDAPFLSYAEYARRTHTTVDNVRYLVRIGKLPIRPKDTPKGHPQINMVALLAEAAALYEEQQSPSAS